MLLGRAPLRLLAPRAAEPPAALCSCSPGAAGGGGGGEAAGFHAVMLGLWAGATPFFFFFLPHFLLSSPSLLPLSTRPPPPSPAGGSAPWPWPQPPAEGPRGASGERGRGQPCGRTGCRARCGGAGDASSGRARAAAWAPSSATSSRSAAASPARRRACSAPWSQVPRH